MRKIVGRTLALLAALLLVFVSCIACDEELYSLTLQFEETEGSVTATPSEQAGGYRKEESVTVTVLPKEGYGVGAVTVNGNEVSLHDTQCSFAIVADTVVAVSFEADAPSPAEPSEPEPENDDVVEEGEGVVPLALRGSWTPVATGGEKIFVGKDGVKWGGEEFPVAAAVFELDGSDAVRCYTFEKEDVRYECWLEHGCVLGLRSPSAEQFFLNARHPVQESAALPAALSSSFGKSFRASPASPNPVDQLTVDEEGGAVWLGGEAFRVVWYDTVTQFVGALCGGKLWYATFEGETVYLSGALSSDVFELSVPVPLKFYGGEMGVYREFGGERVFEIVDEDTVTLDGTELVTSGKDTQCVYIGTQVYWIERKEGALVALGKLTGGNNASSTAEEWIYFLKEDVGSDPVADRWKGTSWTCTDVRKEHVDLTIDALGNIFWNGEECVLLRGGEKVWLLHSGTFYVLAQEEVDYGFGGAPVLMTTLTPFWDIAFNLQQTTLTDS